MWSTESSPIGWDRVTKKACFAMNLLCSLVLSLDLRWVWTQDAVRFVLKGRWRFPSRDLGELLDADMSEPSLVFSDQVRRVFFLLGHVHGEGDGLRLSDVGV
jgi:hypothetical protein